MIVIYFNIYYNIDDIVPWQDDLMSLLSFGRKLYLEFKEKQTFVKGLGVELEHWEFDNRKYKDELTM